jgi:hypothetical protein
MSKKEINITLEILNFREYSADQFWQIRRSGGTYNGVLLEELINQNQMAVLLTYQNNGYLFSNINAVE